MYVIHDKISFKHKKTLASDLWQGFKCKLINDKPTYREDLYYIKLLKRQNYQEVWKRLIGRVDIEEWGKCETSQERGNRTHTVHVENCEGTKLLIKI